MENNIINNFTYEVKDNIHDVFRKTQDWVKTVPLRLLKSDDEKRIEIGATFRTIDSIPRYIIVFEFYQIQDITTINFKVINKKIKNTNWLKLRTIEFYEDYLHNIDDNLSNEYLNEIYPKQYFDIFYKRKKTTFIVLGYLIGFFIIYTIYSYVYATNYKNLLYLIFSLALGLSWLIINYVEKKRVREKIDKSKFKTYASVRGDSSWKK